MLQRINKAQPATWTSPSNLQIGLDENKVELENLSVAEQKIISSLYSGILVGNELMVDQLAGAEPGETQNLLQRLQPIIETQAKPSFGPWQEIAFAEIARASLDYKINGEMVMAERWQATAHIDQLDKTGYLLAKALVAAGIGKVLTHDQGVVLRTDVGELGYPKSTLGQSRFAVATSMLCELAGNSIASRLVNLEKQPDPKVKISFAVTVGHLALNPRTYSRWLSRDVSHLAIVYELDRACISPVVIPGKTACLNCLQELKVDTEPAWPVIATQLLGLPRTRDDASALLSSTGLACRSILRRIDELAGFEYQGEQTQNTLAGYTIEYSTGNVSRVSYQPHQLCSCQSAG